MINKDIKLRFLFLTQDREVIRTEPIANILDFIQTGKLSTLVNEIRNSTSEEKKKKLKLKLPAFYPNLLFQENDTNETIRPSGIIGFDIDLQDNEKNLDFDTEKLKKEIISIPSCIYTYISPSGGLKFGIKTDFTDSDGDDSVTARFKTAYNLTLNYLKDKISTHFVCDNSSASIFLSSFFSYDPDAYINLDCEIHSINSQCVYIPDNSSISVEPESRQDIEYILELLQFIQKKFSYAERLKINYVVLKCLGAAGKNILINHWTAVGLPRSKIEIQINAQSKKIKFGSIGYLVNMAKEYGYKKISTGRSRNHLRPKKSEVQLKSLLSVEEGTVKIQEIVRNFFNQYNNVFVNVSAGSGKSSTVLKILAEEIPFNKKILFLVPTHALANELEKKFKLARNKPEIDEYEEKHKLGKSILHKEKDSMIVHIKTFNNPISGVVHFYGKDWLCKSVFAKEAFGGASNIPLKFCQTCNYPTGCRYIEQFQNRFDNIRIMTHNEWTNTQSGWFGGYEERYGSFKEIKGNYVKINDEYVEVIRNEDGSYEFVVLNGEKIKITDGEIKLNGVSLDVSRKYIKNDDEFLDVTDEYLEESGNLYPSGKKWEPDYIIIDENIISVALEKIKSDDGSKYKCIHNIIKSVNEGNSLAKAIEANLSNVIIDSIENVKPKFPTFKQDIPEYCKLLSTRNNQLKFYSDILERLESYIKTRDPMYLQGMWVADDQLYLAPVSHASKHYQNTPTLFLDATANAEVVKATLGNINFHSIVIQSKRDINLYQLANFTITKTYVNEAKNREDLISWIKDIIKQGQYKKIGIITYLRATGIQGNFAEYLAEETGAHVKGHFGAIRGIDEFDEVDCLLIVGRHFIGTESVEKVSAAIFGNMEKYNSTYADMPVRMKDGSQYLVNSGIQISGCHAVINEHFSLAETKQAIGRSRAIHGKKKDVYLFCNESLGLDIEVTDFFYRDAKDTVTCSNEAIQKIKSIGYVLNKPKALSNIGLNENDIKSRREALAEKLAENEIILIKCNMIDGTYRKSVVEYFIADKSKFTAGAKFDKKAFQSFVEAEN